MRFSQRIGITPIKTKLQIESMDQDLRNSLWNAFQIFFLDVVKSELYKLNENRLEKSIFYTFFRRLWFQFFKLPLDNLGNYFRDTYSRIREWFFEWEWNEVYDFIEFVSQADSPADKESFRKTCNDILEIEVSGYRFVGNLIAEITDKNELKAIEEAIESSQKTKLSGVHTHLESALSKLSDRKNPDYRNSIKESISAVESISQVISGNPKATLGQALKVIKDKVGLHPSLERGFSAIYGYTSDEGGIRHAMLEANKCDFEDAKYMLVACSAFINYLIMKATKAGVKF